MFHDSRFMFYVLELNMHTFILGEKLGMTEWWNKKKEIEPITLVDCKRTILVGKKFLKKDGYSSEILGIVKKKQEGKDRKSNFLKSNANFSVLKEFRTDETEASENSPEAGADLKVDIFKEGDLVKVTALSKGKGTQGVVKRHHFAGGPKSHGHRHALRSAGSIGSAFPEHVQKGKRMAGSMGYEKVTVKNSKVAWVDVEKNIMAIKGAIPGRKGSWVKIIGN